ncbi:unnamed protein product [Caenorhabditis brenneri]
MNSGTVTLSSVFFNIISKLKIHDGLQRQQLRLPLRCSDRMPKEVPVSSALLLGVQHRAQETVCLRGATHRVRTVLPGLPRGLMLAVDATMDFEEPATFKMLVCPSHCTSAPASHHIPACCKPDCKKNGELQKCRNCICSFHPSCRKVEKLNRLNRQKDATEDFCDTCLCEEVIAVGTPIIALCP